MIVVIYVFLGTKLRILIQYIISDNFQTLKSKITEKILKVLKKSAFNALDGQGEVPTHKMVMVQMKERLMLHY